MFLEFKDGKSYVDEIASEQLHSTLDPHNRYRFADENKGQGSGYKTSRRAKTVIGYEGESLNSDTTKK